MSRRVKIKKIKPKKQDKNNADDLAEIFDQILGNKGADPKIIIPKLKKIETNIKKISKTFENLQILKNDFPNFSDGLDKIDEFKKSLDLFLEENPDFYKLSKEELNQYLEDIKESNQIKALIVLCSSLKKYKPYIEDKENLKDNFIMQEPGLNLFIFNFSNFCLKELWMEKNITKNVKQFILSILHFLYFKVYEIYDILTSPMVDIDKFIEIIKTSLEKIKKQPGLNRCSQAFKRIEESIHLLKDNFSTYYRESTISNNSSMLLENFILDVSNQNTNVNPTIAREFRLIIQHIHKLSKQSKTADPRIDKLFNLMNKNLDQIEK